MKTFVTGATGLLGSNLVQTLLAEGHEVKCLVRSSAKAAKVFPGLAVQLIEGDMKDVSGFATAMKGCDVVFHAAAYFREYYQPGSSSDEMRSINYQGTIDLLTQAEAQGVSRVIYVSSSGIIGLKPSGAAGDEDTPPGDAVKWNKYFAEKLETGRAVEELQKNHSIAIIQVLPGWMFGPGDRGPTGSGQLVVNYLQRRILASMDGGSNAVDARDVATVMLRAAQQGKAGDRFLAGGHYVSFREILRDLEMVSGVPAPSIALPYSVTLGFAGISFLFGALTRRQVMVTPESVRVMHARLKVDSSRAERELGAHFRPFIETLSDEVQWFRQNGYVAEKK
jgi:dihydroflavonol-4-reductase